jgi:hypothetical protein
MTCTPLLCVRSHDDIRAQTERHASPYEAPNLSIQLTRFARRSP